jgi:hypothetical protein
LFQFRFTADVKHLLTLLVGFILVPVWGPYICRWEVEEEVQDDR